MCVLPAISFGQRCADCSSRISFAHIPLPFFTGFSEECRLRANDAFVDRKLSIAALDGQIRVNTTVTQAACIFASATHAASEYIVLALIVNDVDHLFATSL